MEINRKILIKKFLDFFKEKGHAEIKNSSLIPENDPTVLFTTAGMHPLVPYLLGETHPQGKRLVDVQRCIRTVDIDVVGDKHHHTMFEMLGNWSLGDYFKKESINFSFEFLTKSLNLPTEKLSVTVFAGDEDCERDEESAQIWKSLGIPQKHIAFLPKKDNWWGPAGETGPCGSDTEIFYWCNNEERVPESFDPENKNWVEIWNNVLMGFTKNKEGKYIEAAQKNIDTGMGVERTVAILNGLEDNYEADMWKPIIEKIESISNLKYKNHKKEMRIIADHVKASVFILADGVVPGNSEHGYILRRLIRRAVRNLRLLDESLIEKNNLAKIAIPVFEIYDDYSILQENKEKILNELNVEENKFLKTLENGLREFEKITYSGNINNKDAFLLYQSYGFPLEMIIEMAKEKNIEIDVDGFTKECDVHKKLSRTAAVGKFKSGLADNSEATKKLHTATHLLNEVLRIVLDNSNICQKGSNITPERLRFDFNFDRKLTPEEIKKVEDLVNLKIQSSLPVHCDIMHLDKAREYGAQGVFDSKYEEEVKVYSIGSIGGEFSKEICAGPHVENTSELGHFKIIKEESSSAGIRRIKAVLE